MANGRLYLRNKNSGEMIFMGKSFGGEYYLCDFEIINEGDIKQEDGETTLKMEDEYKDYKLKEAAGDIEKLLDEVRGRHL